VGWSEAGDQGSPKERVREDRRTEKSIKKKEGEGKIEGAGEQRRAD
jgi:hypothetical protein